MSIQSLEEEHRNAETTIKTLENRFSEMEERMDSLIEDKKQVELDLHASQVKANNLEKHFNVLISEKEQMAENHSREV